MPQRQAGSGTHYAMEQHCPTTGIGGLNDVAVTMESVRSVPGCCTETYQMHPGVKRGHVPKRADGLKEQFLAVLDLLKNFLRNRRFEDKEFGHVEASRVKLRR